MKSTTCRVYKDINQKQMSYFNTSNLFWEDFVTQIQFWALKPNYHFEWSHIMYPNRTHYHISVANVCLILGGKGSNSWKITELKESQIWTTDLSLFSQKPRHYYNESVKYASEDPSVFWEMWKGEISARVTWQIGLLSFYLYLSHLTGRAKIFPIPLLFARGLEWQIANLVIMQFISCLYFTAVCGYYAGFIRAKLQ